MAGIFLCGALAFEPLADAVLGSVGQLSDLNLSGYRQSSVAEGRLSALVPDAGYSVPGKVLRGASEEAEARFRYFLSVFGVEAQQLTVEVQKLWFPAGNPVLPDWDAGIWSARYATLMTRVAFEVMTHRTTYTAQEMAARLPPILARAELWVNQNAEPPTPEHDAERDVIVHAVHRPYMNFFAVQEMDLQFRKQDGTMSEVMNRGALQLGEASVVLPYDPVTDSVLLIQQFRASLLIGGSRAPWVWETVAGMTDPSETPVETAHREAMEEAGLTLWHLEQVADGVSSPGCMSDRLFLYVGLTDLSRLEDGGGLASEGEDIKREIVSFDDLMAGVDSGRYRAIPMLALALWLARHRDRLRAMV
ncbi:MAG: NUDIX domain-containing protein [Paracoccaceae bacterium]